MTPQEIADASNLLDLHQQILKKLSQFPPLQLNALEEVRRLEAMRERMKGDFPEAQQARLEVARAFMEEDRALGRPQARPTGPIQPLPPTPFGYTPERAAQEADQGLETHVAALGLSAEASKREFEDKLAGRPRKPLEIVVVPMKPYSPPETAKKGFWASIADSIVNWRARRKEAARAALFDRIYREVGAARARLVGHPAAEAELAAVFDRLQADLDRAGYNTNVRAVLDDRPDTIERALSNAVIFLMEKTPEKLK